MRTRVLSGTLSMVNRPGAGGTNVGLPTGSAALGLTEATSNLGLAADWAAGCDATPSSRASHVTTTTLFISAPSARRDKRRIAGAIRRARNGHAYELTPLRHRASTIRF